MDNANARADEQPVAPETPEDVAILYSWANLPGAKYRDFSASRREYRAQQRARAAEAQRQAELKAARDLEEAAQREVEEAQKQLEATRQAEAKAAADAAADAEAKRLAEEILRRAEERAEQERQEALRRQQSAEELRVMAERAQEEMLEARKRAEEQAARYAEAERSKEQAGGKARVLPGETTDPYYYSGPVDPAFFASTPGVRTAQPARVSTERKAYVYPMHPGSEEFDAGTLAYRGVSHFGPSPLQILPDQNEGHAGGVNQGILGKNPSAQRDTAQESTHSQDRDAEYNLDDDYYDGDHAARVFSPSPRTHFSGERSASDLHIRPATRVSGERERQSRVVRPSPMPQSAVPAQPHKALSAEHRQPEPPAPVETRGSEVERSFSERFASGPSFFHADAMSRRESPMQETEVAPVMEKPEVFLPAKGETRLFDSEGALSGIRFQEEPALDLTDASRMFIPSPRRRTLQPEDELTADETCDRDIAAAEGQQRSQAEAESRSTLDRFVRAQQDGEPEVTETLPSTEANPMFKLAEDPVAPLEEPMQWRALGRDNENGFRRRRQPGREPVARTARQPRVVQERKISESAMHSASPPAWIRGERARGRSGETVRVEGGAGPDVPATQGDPGVTAPRPVIRPLPSGLKPRGRVDSVAQPAGTTQEANVVSGVVPGGSKPGQEERRRQEDLQAGGGSASDSLQQSRERVASRWFALSGLMDSEGRPSGDSRVGHRFAPRPAPMLSVLSISGGVGKTSIVATLGRALSAMGEKVMLADTNVHGVLPYYFGARDQRPGAVRTFSPPPGSSDAPVILASYDADGRAYDEEGQKRVLEDLYRRSNEVQRVLLDAGVNSAWLARTVAATNPWVLVPVAPDMNSVLGTQAVERLFQDVTGADGRPVKPYYVLNQYDPTMPLHLDVREVLRQFLGDRLLPIMLHRTPVVSEALAEGMTVIDYAPRASIATDYMKLAAWVRKLADPGLSFARPARWSER